MNKTDRMLALVLELQRKGRQRAADLARTFETSTRTIYRDVQALCEAGVPVVGSPGQGYWLAEGYFLPPVSFTAEEAVALLMGASFIERHFDAGYREAAGSSRAKLEAILPEAVKADAERIIAGMKLIVPRRDGSRPEEERKLELLRRAVLEERTVRFRYVKKFAGPDGARESVREADPYGLVFTGSVWMLLAFCRFRQGLRHFRLSRLSDLELTDERFRRPAGFDLSAYSPPDDRTLRVRIRVRSEFAGRVKEDAGFWLETEEAEDEGRVLTLRIRQVEEVLSTVLGWGAEAVVLEPEALRRKIREEAEKMLNCY